MKRISKLMEDKNMRISGSYNPYAVNNSGNDSKKPSSVREYSN